jgi:deglycase
MNTGTPNDKQRKIAILATDGVERVELTEPRRALEAAGFTTELVSPAEGELQAWDHDEKSQRLKVDVALNAARSDDYAGLVLPGGVQNPDHLRMDRTAVEFVRSFIDANKPVAAICHGPWLLAEAGVLDGMHMTSWPSLQTDLRNAGATWSDDVVVADDWLVTSRKPDDLPQFCAKATELFDSYGERAITGKAEARA